MERQSTQQRKQLIFHPKLWSMLKNYNMKLFIGDLTAGAIVAIIALPLSIALAIASGVAPEKGLLTAIVAGFIISAFGGSRVQIGGPTGAFMIIVYGIVTKFGINGLIVATMMAGILMILFGLLRLGTVVKFIPYTITVGFTTGIAITIFSSQMNDFFGLRIADLPAEFIHKWHAYILAIRDVHLPSMLLGLIAIAVIIIMPKLTAKVPGTLVAIVVTSLVAYWLKMDVETIGSRFGSLSNRLPMPSLPELTIDNIRLLFPSALTIALLGSIESLLSAVVADGMCGGKHRSNTELIAQGMANIGSALFGGIPATGAIARTTANVKNGGKTPIAGMVHSLVLLGILLAFMPLMGVIPMPTLSAILIIVAYNMSELHVFLQLLKSHKSDVLVLLVTFVLTVFVDLVVAIEFGMVISVFIFMKRMSDTTTISELVLDAAEESEIDRDMSVETQIEDLKIPHVKDKVQVYEINGPLFFGAAEAFIEQFTNLSKGCKVLIIRMRHVSIIDATAVRALSLVVDRCQKTHIDLMITGLRDEPYKALLKGGVIERIGQDRVFHTLEEAKSQVTILSDNQ